MKALKLRLVMRSNFWKSMSLFFNCRWPSEYDTLPSGLWWANEFVYLNFKKFTSLNEIDVNKFPLLVRHVFCKCDKIGFWLLPSSFFLNWNFQLHIRLIDLFSSNELNSNAPNWNAELRFHFCWMLNCSWMSKWTGRKKI